jgi:predicted ATPase
MKIAVKNFGAIKEGTVDLSKKLNIFCGPNGTGKTYMAYMIYGLLKSQIHFGQDIELAQNLIENRKITYPINIKNLNKYRTALIENFKNEFDSLFGISPELAKLYFDTTEIFYAENEEEYFELIIKSEFKTTISIRKLEVEVTKTANTDYLELEISERIMSNKDIDLIEFFLYSSILSLLASYPISSTYISPVERNSIFTFSKELSINKQEAVDHFHAMTAKTKIDKFELLFKKTTRYPLPIKDGLIIADDLAEIKKNTGKFFEFANQIEHELLKGKVLITSDGEIQFKPEKAQKRSLPIHMTASIVKSLSSLVVYLKHIAQENDLIIIDEPEINLHPDNQIILTRLFARLINKGFRIMISTHSDYVVRELNNLIMLSSNKNQIQDLKEKFGYGADEFINKKDISVHYFNYPQKLRGNKQVNIVSIEVEDNGFEIPSVGLAIENQNEISEELYYRLNYDENE